MLKLLVDLLVAGADWVPSLPPSNHQSPKPEWQHYDDDQDHDDDDHHNHDHYDHEDDYDDSSKALLVQAKYVQSYPLLCTLTSGQHEE